MSCSLTIQNIDKCDLEFVNNNTLIITHKENNKNKQINKNYNLELITDGIIFTHTKNIINKQLNNESCNNIYIKIPNVKKSSIISCYLNNKSITKSYRALVLGIWENMTTDEIYNNSTFKTNTDKENINKSYDWYENKQIYFQNKDANGCLKEIIQMINRNKMKINLEIKLENNKIFKLIKNYNDYIKLK